MAQVDDLSRSLAVFDQSTSLTVAVELSEASWLVAGLVPGIDRQPLKKLAFDPDTLLRLLERLEQAPEEGANAMVRLLARIVSAVQAAVSDPNSKPAYTAPQLTRPISVRTEARNRPVQGWSRQPSFPTGKPVQKRRSGSFNRPSSPSTVPGRR